MVGIYKITSPSDKVYIGQSYDVKKRLDRYKRLSCKLQHRLYNSFKKYGVDKHKFEIITECRLDELNDLERYYQELYSCIGKKGLNCKLTKTSDRVGQHSEETRRKMSIAVTGRVTSDETKLKLSKIGKGRIISDETRKRMSIASIGKKMSAETRRKVSEAGRGRVTSAETKIKLSKAGIGRKHSDETKMKLSIAHKGNDNGRSKLIINTETGIFYDSIKIAARSVKTSPTTLSYKLNGIRRNNTSLTFA